MRAWWGIQTYSANVEHDIGFLDKAQTFLQQQDLFSLASLFLLMHV